ncbi:L-aminopeptidase/D-esterase-like protein [Roseibium hamelinense]|uniref:L-aminopeptidase/D-esterase-like protein n=1 Tax=Roseibium hamelinense TaxID=150831 RepID=A0A562TC01_9HYPH|nr:P1 family peptidase [Roseibium hamelinense]MTI45150.1 peptidase S58 family protein [Roseibium hamelinense]TWI90490.1 L-aminopeptidase/D-esterase-like protein [Roseibium hamelinense]
MPGPRNLITDVPGLKVGNASDHALKSGATVLLPDDPAVASVAIHGGAPGTREIALLEPEQTVDKVDAVVLAGGSSFGLDAGAGVQGRLAELGYGFAVGPVRVPIVPTAILFDLINGGDKSWGEAAPYRDLGRAALDAVSEDFALGSVGAGAGATTANLKGGLGSASIVLENGVTVGALVAVNALGRGTVGDTRHFWAAPFEQSNEFGGYGLPSPLPLDATHVRTKLDALKAGANTTIAAVATDAVLTKAEAKRLAVMAHDGLARALWPAHTPLDGDLVFALSTGQKKLDRALEDMVQIGAAAASCLARAVARGIYHATAAEGDPVPTWRGRFG